MRITHIISNLGLGGAEGALCSLIEAQAGSDVRHTVISMLPGGAYAPRLKAAGAEVIEFNGTRSATFALRFCELGRTLALTSPDVIQGWMYHGNIAASALGLSRYSSAPVVWGVRQSVSRLVDDTLMTRALILGGVPFAFQPRQIIYNSEMGALTHERIGYPRSKRLIIHNGVDCLRFKPRAEAREQLIASLGLSPNARLLGRVARYAAMKDFRTLFEAFARVRHAVPAAELVLVGPGIDDGNRNLMADWRAAGAPDGVHFLGPRQDVQNVYPALDVMVSSSQSNEGFSNAVFESIACGTPVVATDVGTGSEFRECEVTVVEPRKPDKIAEAMQGVLAMSPEARRAMASRAQAVVASRFGLGAYSAAFLQVWRQAITVAPAGGGNNS